MKLITMAYMGEALGVIEKFGLRRISENHFENEALTLILTGEGPFEASTLTAKFLARGQYDEVFNLGLAGTLSTELDLGQIVEVRTFYLAIENKPSFKSFSLGSQGIDCVTNFKRVQDSKDAEILKGVGKIVDREGWGVAFAARNEQVSFQSFKLISDVAGTAACLDVMEKAPAYSMQLADFLSAKLKTLSSTEDEFNFPGYYFTFTSSHRLKNLLQKLSIKSQISTETYLEKILAEVSWPEKMLPKDRGLNLIQELEFRLDPMKKNLDQKLSLWKKPFIDAGITLQTDSTWESKKVKIIFEAEDLKNLEDKIKVLSKLDLTSYHQLLDGQNVE